MACTNPVVHYLFESSMCCSQEEMRAPSKKVTRIFVARIPPSVTEAAFRRFHGPRAYSCSSVLSRFEISFMLICCVGMWCGFTVDETKCVLCFLLLQPF